MYICIYIYTHVERDTYFMTYPFPFPVPFLSPFPSTPTRLEYDKHIEGIPLRSARSLSKGVSKYTCCSLLIRCTQFVCSDSCESVQTS